MKRAFLLSIFLIACGDDAAEQAPEENVVENPAGIPTDKEDAATQVNTGKADFTLDICKHNKWYGDGECDWYCPRRDEDCNAAPLGLKPVGVSTKHPIVLAHGFMGSPTNFWSFYGVKAALEADGHRVFEGEVPPFASVETRATVLAAQIDQALAETGAEKVNIIAHSMGGMDSRYVISSLEYGDRVASLITISTPHGGSRIADVALKLGSVIDFILPGDPEVALNALLRVIGRKFSNEADKADLSGALASISEENAKTFGQQNPDDSRIYYASWAGISSITGLRNGDAIRDCENKALLHDGTYDRMDALLWAVVPFVAGVISAPNDGMVKVNNAKHGEFMGCVPADHLDEVGQISDGPNEDTGFDHIRFYRNIAFSISARGL